MGSFVKQIQFLILSILISAVLCYTNHGSIASGSMLKSFPDDDSRGTPALKFLYTIEDPETKIPCTMANMSLSIVVNYTTKQHMVVTKQVKIPSNVTVKGACGPMVSEMSLLWKTWEDDKFQQNVVKFVLFNDRTNFSVFSIDVDLFLDSDSFPNATDERRTTRSDIDLGFFDAPVEDGLHKCPKERRIKVDNDTALITSDVSFIAFNTKKDYGLRKVMICDDGANTKVFPFHVEEKHYYGVSLLARMSFNVEIPYLTINDTIAKYTKQLPTRDTTIFGYISESYIDDSLTGYMSLFIKLPDLSSLYDITIHFNQDIDDVAYISRIEFRVAISKKDLPGAKYAITRSVEKHHLALFPTPSDSGIFSCSRGITLYMDGIRLQMTDVLLVMFDKTRDFSSKQVIDCNKQLKLTKEDFSYAVQEKDGAVPCILANMSISMRIPYPIIAANTVYANITVPTNATVNGYCGSSLSKLELTWPAEDRQLNSVAFYLSRESNFSMFHLETNIYIDNTSFPNISGLFAHQWEGYSSNFSLGMFVGPNDNAWYHCPKRQEIIRDGGMTITISNVSLIAFNDQEDLSIKKAYVCSNDENKNDTTVQPHPSEAAFKYVVRNEEKNIACILANMTISVKVTYKTKSNSNRETTFVVPEDGVNVTGNCDCKNPKLTLSWVPKGVVPDPEQPYKTKNSISLIFSGDYWNFYVSMIDVDFYLDENHFPDTLESRYTITESKRDLFTSYMTNVYKCNLETVVELRNVQLTFNDVALTAFNNYRNVSQLKVDECRIASTYINIPIVLASVVGSLLIGCGVGGIIYACMRHNKKH